MKDINRIERVIKLIKEAWYKHPELRLTQLIMNALKIHRDPYYIEDDFLEDALKEYIKMAEGEKFDNKSNIQDSK